MGSVLPNDAGDPALNTWILWWNTQTMPFSTAWWNAPAFYPAPGVLSFSENLLGLSLISTPLHWLGAGPQAAYNVVFLLTFPLSALGAYLLGYELTKRHDAAFIAGLLFGFAPYRIAHLPQIQSLASFPMPFALLGLHRYLRDPRPKWLALFAAGWFLQGLCNGYYLLFFSVFVGIVDAVVREPVVAAATVSRHRPRVGDCRDSDAAAAAALSRAFTRRSDSRAISGPSATSAPMWRASCTRRCTSRCGDGSTCFGAPKGSCFRVSPSTLLVLAGAIFVRDRESRRTSTAGRSRGAILIVLTIATAARIGKRASSSGRGGSQPFGIRLLSVSNPIKPLTVSLVLRARPCADEPRAAARVSGAFGHRLLRGRGLRDVAVQPRARADADGQTRSCIAGRMRC